MRCACVQSPRPPQRRAGFHQSSWQWRLRRRHRRGMLREQAHGARGWLAEGLSREAAVANRKHQPQAGGPQGVRRQATHSRPGARTTAAGQVQLGSVTCTSCRLPGQARVRQRLAAAAAAAADALAWDGRTACACWCAGFSSKAVVRVWQGASGPHLRLHAAARRPHHAGEGGLRHARYGTRASAAACLLAGIPACKQHAALQILRHGV
mmetsp:Transcript_38232/g.113327  ORF Transcript_38232/g.113327 Transcript_38232/m.113327 type:complete len:209 (+) Transcript_38232:92-718(+)